MLFRSPTLEDVQISLTSGHMAVVTAEGVELNAMFHREAIAAGCTPEGVARLETLVPEKSFDRALVIGEALQTAMKSGNSDEFKADGFPNLNALIKRVGFHVAREEVDAIWAEVSKD